MRYFGSLIGSGAIVVLLAVASVPAAQEPPKPAVGKSFSFYLARGGRLLETGNYRQALLYLEAALQAPRKGVKSALIDLANTLHLSAIFYEAAQQLRSIGQPEQAVAKYEMIRQVNPNDPRPLELIIEIYDLLSEQAERAGQYEEAARLYERWSYYDPRNDFPRQNVIKMVTQLVASAEERGEPTTLLAAYRQLARLVPSDQTIREKILRLELARERERTINEALAFLRPEDPARLPQAIAAIEGALSVYPEETQLQAAQRQARGWYERFQAETLMQQYRYVEALRFYQAMLTYFPAEAATVAAKTAEVHRRLGGDYHSNGFLKLTGQITAPVRLQFKGEEMQLLDKQAFDNLQLAQGKLPPRPFDLYLPNHPRHLSLQVVTLPSVDNDYTAQIVLTPRPGHPATDIELAWEIRATGKINWQGNLTGKEAQLRLQGPYVDALGAATTVKVTADTLPHEAYELRRVSAPAEIKLEIVEDPSPANNFATVLNVISNAPATANATPPTLDLVLEWVLVRRREKEK